MNTMKKLIVGMTTMAVLSAMHVVAAAEGDYTGRFYDDKDTYILEIESSDVRECFTAIESNWPESYCRVTMECKLEDGSSFKCDWGDATVDAIYYNNEGVWVANLTADTIPNDAGDFTNNGFKIVFDDNYGSIEEDTLDMIIDNVSASDEIQVRLQYSIVNDIYYVGGDAADTWHIVSLNADAEDVSGGNTNTDNDTHIPEDDNSTSTPVGDNEDNIDTENNNSDDATSDTSTDDNSNIPVEDKNDTESAEDANTDNSGAIPENENNTDSSSDNAGSTSAGADKTSPDTGAEGIAVVSGAAITAGAAVVLFRKKR
ncbi:MAG: NPXTG-anchored protein [Oscillospiraceae bacterium]|nr:NPXTG-anchored protein [Oscillospiraceae bacterium]